MNANDDGPGARHALSKFERAPPALVALAMLFVLVLPSCSGHVCNDMQAGKAEIDISAISSAIDAYAVEKGGRYPDSLERLVTPDESNNVFLKGYTHVPLDPWKNPYVYEPPADGRGYRVYSLGKDGQPGGWGQNADIESADVSRTAR